MNKLKGLHQSLKVLQQKLSKMKAQEEEGVKVKEELDDDLWFIMYQETVNVNQSFPWRKLSKDLLGSADAGYHIRMLDNGGGTQSSLSGP